MGGLNNVEVINSKGCSRLFVGFSSPVPSFRIFQSFEPMSPAPTTSLPCEPVTVRSTGPFSGLVICVTGLSKEARKQVMEATERLGGQYSTSLHPQCTHLVVQISFLITLFALNYLAFVIIETRNNQYDCKWQVDILCIRC
ncbi:hypothetical protein GQ457_07G039280 [Hibiscus cannabinus]